ncbi:hypothetical protein Pla8534_39380 [Lignipirellula cremea]|uniref:Thiol-disulfide oxidoreductase DCC n=2 Tax=Lignipirellula cremea TaxID=2528010 RepID=A0A518DWB5_9BACT|nr:hypothetical protein Pla8534_39380 [Lignipirellula cremea]
MPIVIFDGLCSFCSASVQFILKNDVRGKIRFAPAQSELGRTLLAKHGLDPDDAQSFLLIKADKAYVRSDAALEIARDLGWWRWLRIFRILPRGLRDAMYSLVARNRYRWFGRRDTCLIPTPEQRSRFIENLEEAADQESFEQRDSPSP